MLIAQALCSSQLELKMHRFLRLEELLAADVLEDVMVAGEVMFCCDSVESSHWWRLTQGVPFVEENLVQENRRQVNCLYISF